MSDEAAGTVEAIQGEVRDAQLLAEIGPQLESLEAMVNDAAEAAAANYAETLASSEDVAAVRDVVGLMRRSYLAFENAKQKIANNPNLSNAGRAAAIDEARALLNAEIDRLQGIVNARTERLINGYPEFIWPAPSAELAREAELIMQSFPIVSAGHFLREALGVLRRATDPATPYTERHRLNHLLARTYGPLLERRATAPEKHAQSQAPIAAKLHELVAAHLKNYTEGGIRDAAIERANIIRGSVNFLRSSADSSGWDDFIAQTGAPELFPVEQAA